MKLASPVPDDSQWMQGMQGSVSSSQDESIGEILVDSGKLSIENTERIRQLQHEQGLRFGEAGIRLGVLSHDDLQFALARQFGYPYLFQGDGPGCASEKAY